MKVLLELEADLLLGLPAHGGVELGDDGVEVPQLARAPEVVVPVRRPGDLRVLAGDERLGPCDREVVTERRLDESLVVVGPGLVVVGELRLHGAREDAEQLLQPAAGLELEVAAAGQRPAALPRLLVLVTPRVALARPGLDVVEPDVLRAGAVGPRLLARHRARVAPDALVEVHHHAHLGHDTHQYVTSCERLRTVETMSRWLPVGPR